MNTLRMFANAKASAKQRGIPFLMTYEQWLAVWRESGRLADRGRAAWQYVMCRTGDAGAYEVGNVYIATGLQNTADAVANGRMKVRRATQGATDAELAAARGVRPVSVPAAVREDARTYRQAVRLAWQLRRVQSMTRQQLATEAELYPQHVTDYLADDDKPQRRDLPADAVARFEAVVGNTMVSQWIASQSHLTVLEELQATKVAA